MKEELRGDLEMSGVRFRFPEISVIWRFLTLPDSRVVVSRFIGIWVISFRRVSLEICERVSLALDWKGLRGFAAILDNSDSLDGKTRFQFIGSDRNGLWDCAVGDDVETEIYGTQPLASPSLPPSNVQHQSQ